MSGTTSKIPILITGSQRSGTTMLHLILDSHPAIRGIDEDRFDEAALSDYLSDAGACTHASFKLPDYVHAVHKTRRWPGLKVLFCVRDPRDVVNSMLTLALPLGPYSLPWIAHPYGGALQIYFCATTLAGHLRKEMATLLGDYPGIAVVPPAVRNQEQNVYCAALCWQLVTRLLPVYRAAGMPVGVVPYERLVLNPELLLREVMTFLDLPFDDALLRHHELHTGRSIGDTDNERPIDSRSIGKWRKYLSAHDLRVIESLCAGTAAEFGYDLE